MKASPTTAAPLSAESERQRLSAKRQRLLARFQKAAEAGKAAALRDLYSQIRQLTEFIAALDALAASELAAPVGRPRYLVSSLFLYESFAHLTADQDEQFFFVTGSEIDGVLVLDQRAEFAHHKRSFAGVTGEPAATHNLLIKLERFGHRLLGHFHSHPGMGAGATRPSGTDEGFQRRLERAGHIAVMGIFSRDGFVQFVRLDRNIDLDVYGHGVEKHDNGLYRLTDLDPA